MPGNCVREYDDLYGDDAYVQMSINYRRFMNEHMLVERARRDHIQSGLCYGYLRMRSPMKAQPKKKSDKKAI